MGSFSHKTTSTTTPQYGPQIEGAANTLRDTYNQQAPKIAGYADQLGSLGTDLLAKYKAGNPMIDAASHYVTSTLNSDPQNNPYLDQMVGLTNNDLRNQIEAAAGSRGQTGGSDYYDMITRTLGKNELGMRYGAYNDAMQRKAQAAGLAPGVSAADYLSIAPALSSLGAASTLPMSAATQYAAGTGGLLGQYGKTTQKTSGGFLGDLLLAGMNAASSAASAGAF